VCCLGCTARPQHPQKETVNASVRALLMSLPVSGNRDNLRTVCPVTYDLCFWLPPPAIPSPTRCTRLTASPCLELKVSHPNLAGAQELHHGICQRFYILMALISYPRLPKPAITQLPKHLVTVSLSPAIISLIHCTTPGATNYLPALTLVHLDQLRSVPAAKLHRLACVKNHPQVNNLFAYNL
jgi:hypothetical protein